MGSKWWVRSHVKAIRNGNFVKSVSTTVTPAKPSVKDLEFTGNTSIMVKIKMIKLIIQMKAK